MIKLIYLVDTPLLLELMRPEPAPAAKSWVKLHERLGLAIAALSLAELQAGLARTTGGRRTSLTRRVLAVERFFLGTAILPFDWQAAQVCARLMARAEADGDPPPLREAMTAAIAEANGLILAARPTPRLELWARGWWIPGPRSPTARPTRHTFPISLDCNRS